MSIEDLKQPLIGDVIKALRKELKLSQEKFASQLGVSFTSLNRWENHKTMPSALALQIINSHLQKLGDKSSDLLKERYLLHK